MFKNKGGIVMARQAPDIKKILDEWPERCDAYEAIDKLKQGIFEDYKRRQAYEWKMCYAIWTFVLGFIVFTVTNPTILISCSFLTGGALIILGIHISWQKSMQRANDHNKDKIFECEEVMYKLLEAEPWDKPDGYKKGWSHYIYVLITLVLISFAFIIVNNRDNRIVVLNTGIYNKLDYSQTIDVKKRNELVNKIMKNHFDSK
jgi:hypothetical protein